jgi:diadenosine tetraphosphatase ApaH/serine/threonine PP2A family protein phosphatase
VRYLILSDIHANWEALEAVLDQATGQYDKIVCCGDLIGYGPDPNAIVDWVRGNVAMVIRGNHDKAAVGLENLEWFNPVARTAAVWTQGELTAENCEYVRQLAKGPLAVDGYQIVHGSPLDEDEYLVGGAEVAQAFAYLDRNVTFFGHTHVQGGFALTRGRGRVLRGPSPDEESAGLDLDPDGAYLINPGAVGQPRDLDPRAAYVLYNPESCGVEYHRQEYDIATVQAKIRRAGLPDFLAERLAVGQ